MLPNQAAARLFGGDLDLLEEGLKRGLRVDATWPMWEVPLLHGICLFSPPKAPEMVKAVLKAGAALDDHRGMSPMLYALGGYNKEDGDPLGVRMGMVKVLHEVDPHPDLSLWAMTAVRLGWNDAVKYLVEAGCSPGASIEGGHTLLHEAYKTKNAEIGNYLVQKGADPHAENAQGKNPAEACTPATDIPNASGAGDAQGQAEMEVLDLAIRTLKSDNLAEGKPFRL